MNWEAAGAIGEIIAAIAVVVTLIFLTFQLRANSAAVRAQTKQALTDNVQLRFLTVASDVSLAELLARTRVSAEFEDLSEKLAGLGIPGIDAEQFDLGLLGNIEVEDLLKILPLLSDVFQIDIESLTGNLPPGLLDALRIDDHARVVDRDVLEDLDLTGLAVDLDRRHLGDVAVGVRAVDPVLFVDDPRRDVVEQVRHDQPGLDALSGVTAIEADPQSLHALCQLGADRCDRFATRRGIVRVKARHRLERNRRILDRAGHRPHVIH